MAEWIEKPEAIDDSVPVPDIEVTEDQPVDIQTDTGNEVEASVEAEVPTQTDESTQEEGYTDEMREENMAKLDQRIADVGEFPVLTGAHQAFDESIDAMSTGLGDFIADASNTIGNLTGVPWFKQYNEWWDTNVPKSKDPVHGMVRDVSAVVIPSLMGGGLIQGVGAATKARHIPQAQRVLASIMARLGIEVGIAGITSQSYEQDNVAGALNQMFGFNIPWGTDKASGPEQRRHYHMLEAGMWEVGLDVD